MHTNKESGVQVLGIDAREEEEVKVVPKLRLVAAKKEEHLRALGGEGREIGREQGRIRRKAKFINYS